MRWVSVVEIYFLSVSTVFIIGPLGICYSRLIVCIKWHVYTDICSYFTKNKFTAYLTKSFQKINKQFCKQ